MTECADLKAATINNGDGIGELNSDAPFGTPDLEPDGWVCRPGPNGRTFWHHKALGPAPWEQPLIKQGDTAYLRSLMHRVTDLAKADKGQWKTWADEDGKGDPTEEWECQHT